MHMWRPKMAKVRPFFATSPRNLPLTLNRPDRLNAWTGEMHDELKDAMYRAGANPTFGRSS